MRSTGIVFVISGPSGVGKGTLISQLLTPGSEMIKSVSCTTRPPRAGERDGVDYRFVTDEEFARMRAQGEFLEWATVHRKWSYGTPRQPVEEALDSGLDVILEIDYQGARTVRGKLGGRAVLVFVAPPSWEELRRRLEGRETESPENLHRRLETATRELENVGLFQYVVVNAEVSQAVSELRAIVVAERCRMGRGTESFVRETVLRETKVGGL